MAPSRGKQKAKRTTNRAGSSRRPPSSTDSTKDGIPGVYQDMLAEAEVNELFESPYPDVDRPLKKRRTLAHVSVSDSPVLRNGVVAQQTAEESSPSEDEDSDIDFEDVDLEQSRPLESNSEDTNIADVSITIDTTTTPQRRSQPKRKPASASEKAFRLLVHKMHLLCMLGHCMYVNSRCNDEEVQRHLKTLVPKNTVAWLNHPAHHSQFDRDRVFIDGLKQASELFRGAFMITESGLQRAKWPVEGAEQVEQDDLDPLDRSAFLAAATEIKGSQDTGNQLFCSMLRSVGVDARLVCSLQCLPFGKAPANSATPVKTVKPVVYAMAPTIQPEEAGSSTGDSSVRNSATIGKIPAVRRRLGQPAFGSEPATPPSSRKKKRPVRKLSYPVFWVEAFNAAYQQWVAVDPIVTQTVSKHPTGKLEPPSSYEFNQMSYVLAFESNGVVRDVTRRYTRAFNAKTRRYRVDSTDHGAQWLKKSLRLFRRRGGKLDRDEIEDAELLRLASKEGLPSNVQDFKDHPVYALERHLKRHEVIHPKTDVGKVNAGTAAKPRMETVYRRADVCVCHNAEKWFRLGREIKKGEVAVKRVLSRRQRQVDDDEDDGAESDPTMGLYAVFQTQLYVPAPVVGGKVPKNAFGNLDIYVPSMVPAGSAHIEHSLASQAAKILKIDYADAVTGFQFKGRHGTAIIRGCVVAEEYADAVRAIVEGLEDERNEEQSKARSATALRMWRRFLIGLRITDRVSAYGDGKEESDIKMEIDAAEEEQDAAVEAGGFFPGEVGDGFALPTAGRFSLEELATPKTKQKRTLTRRGRDDSAEEASFTSESEEEVTVPMKRTTRGKRKVIHQDSGDEDMPDVIDDDEMEGGFVHDENGNEEGGGFLPEGEQVTNDDYVGAGGFLPDQADHLSEHDFDGGGFLIEGEEPDEEMMDTTTTAPVEQYGLDGPKEAATIQEEFRSNPMLVDDRTSHPIFRMESDGLNNTRPSELDTVVQADLDHSVPTNDSSSQAAQVTQNTQDQTDEGGQTDQGSMLSHDPEDEDAEPDWLESDSD